MQNDGLYGCYVDFRATILHTFGVQAGLKFRDLGCKVFRDFRVFGSRI